jgi:hypothetical protein
MATLQDVEMVEAEAPHALQLQFEDAEELVALYGPSSSPDEGIARYQSILSYGASGRIEKGGERREKRG